MGDSFILNVSFVMPPVLVDEWEAWRNKEIDKFLMENPCLKSETFEVVSEQPGGNALFSVQWRCCSLEEVKVIDKFLSSALPGLSLLFGDRVNHFSSLMKKVG
ncbi:hypothetical protein QA597_04130 [Marinilabiliaceae bacterium ANBcel2]|nr:hypothetical protein [Marinilabiliaceae bacterium ANBcel2]